MVRILGLNSILARNKVTQSMSTAAIGVTNTVDMSHSALPDHPFAFWWRFSPHSSTASQRMSYSSSRHIPHSSTLTRLKGRVAYAQHALHRHVVLKLVKESIKLPHLVSLESFCGIIPAIGFLCLDHHSLIVMPRQDVFTSHNNH